MSLSLIGSISFIFVISLSTWQHVAARAIPYAVRGKEDRPVKWNVLSNRQASCWEYQTIKKKMQHASLQPWCQKDPGWLPKAFFAISAHVCLKRANKIAFIIREVWKSSFLFCGLIAARREPISHFCVWWKAGERGEPLWCRFESFTDDDIIVGFAVGVLWSNEWDEC